MKNANQFYKDIIIRISEQSECLSRKVGAIAVIDGRIIGEGWNSPPPKCHVLECIRCNSKEKIESGTQVELSLCGHGESNLTSNCAYLGISLKNAIIYCTTKPCSSCATLLVQSGVSKIYYIHDYNSLYTDLILDRGKVKHSVF